ncbi:hypothetical protein KAN5_30240 [Pseudoalteromonas sp. KAN5]|nr:hypothetical protein KAN5_30240 [Pseudoalteromonas sp. KAN5]
MASAIEQRIVTFLLKHIKGIKLIYLFSSHNQGTANKNSDIDLVDLNSASTVLQVQVISSLR